MPIDINKILELDENINNRLMIDREYYYTDEAKQDYNNLKNMKEQYLKENPTNYLYRGMDLLQNRWFYSKYALPKEKQLYSLAGEARELELQKKLNKSLKLYELAKELFSELYSEEYKKIEEEVGHKLSPNIIEQRIDVVELLIFREKTKNMEKEAKKLEETEPYKAIEIYEKLNKLRPGLKKYDKRIEIINRNIK